MPIAFPCLKYLNDLHCSKDKVKNCTIVIPKL